MAKFSIDRDRLRIYEATAEGAHEALIKVSQAIREMDGERFRLERRIQEFTDRKHHDADQLTAMKARLAEFKEEIADRKRDEAVLRDKWENASRVRTLVAEYVEKNTPLRRGTVRLPGLSYDMLPSNNPGASDA